MLKRLVLALLPEATEASRGASAALWTFPLVLGSAFLIAWGAEVAQFFMSQGLALAILAWLQTLPEFAVEADIAWRRNVANMTANFTGSLRLLVGLGWPLILFVASWTHKRKTGVWLKEIVLEPQHSIEVIGLLAPILYFVVVWFKASLTVWDGAVLIVIYLVYLVILNKMPPEDQEEAEELDLVPRTVLSLPKGVRAGAIGGLFLGGGLILYFVTHPFVDSLRDLAVSFGLSEYVFIQWVAPFLSEFPEFLSAVRWARTVRHAPMALMNVVSSNINQWTVLAGMIPIVYSLSLGHVAAVPLGETQRQEILLTILQSLLGMVLLLNMRYSIWEALALFGLWVVQFFVPPARPEIALVFGVLIVLGILQVFRGGRGMEAFTQFSRYFKSRVLSTGG
jgi:cation:H+ antiporter